MFRDAYELLVGVTVPGGHPLTAVVHIDNELGGVATDGYVAQSPLASVVELLDEDDDPDVRVHDIPLADARARISAALAELDLGPGRVGSETCAESRALVEWLLSLLPEGRSGLRAAGAVGGRHAERGLRQELTDDALAAVDASAETFLVAVRELDEN